MWSRLQAVRTSRTDRQCTSQVAASVAVYSLEFVFMLKMFDFQKKIVNRVFGYIMSFHGSFVQ